MVEMDLLSTAPHESRKKFWRWQLLLFSASSSNDFETATSEQGPLVIYYIFNLATWVFIIRKSLQKKKNQPNQTQQPLEGLQELQEQLFPEGENSPKKVMVPTK